MVAWPLPHEELTVRPKMTSRMTCLHRKCRKEVFQHRSPFLVIKLEENRRHLEKTARKNLLRWDEYLNSENRVIRGGTSRRSRQHDSCSTNSISTSRPPGSFDQFAD